MKKQAPPIEYGKAPQADALATLSCPTCGGPWSGRAVKVCRLCGRPLGRNDRWRMVPFGPGLVAIEHYECDTPTHK